MSEPAADPPTQAMEDQMDDVDKSVGQCDQVNYWFPADYGIQNTEFDHCILMKASVLKI